jgi:hypothetical protein
MPIICLSVDIIVFFRRQKEMNQDQGFTHIGLKKGTQRKIAILSRVIGPRIYELVAIWTNDAWEMAKKQGMVTDAMLEETPAHWVGKKEEKGE